MARFAVFLPYNPSRLTKKLCSLLGVATAMTLWSSSGLCDLPPAVTKVIESQKPAFHKVLDTLTPTQHRLILERYTDLLLSSPFTLGMKIDRAELIAYLALEFPYAERKQSGEVPQYSPSVDGEITQLSKSFQGEFKDGLLNLKFKCEGEIYEFPFTIGPAGPVAFEMAFYGIPVPEAVGKILPIDRCLSIFFVAKSLPATIETINSKNVACPLPHKGAGTCLLNIAEQIVASTKREHVKLTDGSKIRCSSNHQPTSLWHLRVYQGRPTWYENNSYKVVEKMRAKREEALKAARTYTLKQLLEDAKTPKEIPMERAREATKLLENLAKELDDPSDTATVANFMSALWEKDCASYVLIDELITWPIGGFKYGALFPTVDEFEKALHND